MKSLVSPSFIKQKTRQIKKEKSLSQSDALNEAVKEYGFSNYKSYLNALEKNRTAPSADSSEKRLRFNAIFSEKDFSKSEHLAISFIHDFNPTFRELFEIINHFKFAAEGIEQVCQQSDLQNEVQKSLLNYFIESKSDIQALPLKEYFIAKSTSVRSLNYELIEDKIHVQGKYHLEFEFEMEVPDENKHLPHFRRDPMFGDFEAIIDKDMNITFENPSIGEEVDGRLCMGSFKLG